MALITFRDLPNTTTPLSAANLNNNFSELDNNINDLENEINKLKDNDWKVLNAAVGKNQTISLPNNYKELYVKAFILDTRGSNTNIVINFYLPKISLSSSTQTFRNGFYATSTVNGAAALEVSQTSLRYLDGHFGGVSVDSNISVWYR